MQLSSRTESRANEAGAAAMGLEMLQPIPISPLFRMG